MAAEAIPTRLAMAACGYTCLIAAKWLSRGSSSCSYLGHDGYTSHFVYIHQRILVDLFVVR